MLGEWEPVYDTYRFVSKGRWGTFFLSFSSIEDYKELSASREDKIPCVITENESSDTSYVFKDAEITSVIEIASKLCLKFVQLHGKESPDYIKTLNEKCPQLTIIKALGMNESLSHEDLVLFKEYAATADYLLLDSKNPGSGKEFDKSLIPDFINKDKTIISGGIGPSNIASILTLNFCGVDCNSCLESAPGKKDPVLVRELFNRINEIKE